MYDDAALLASSFSSFISQLSNYSTDWQIMVSNNDDGCTNSGGVETGDESHDKQRCMLEHDSGDDDGKLELGSAKGMDCSTIFAKSMPEPIWLSC